MIGNLGWVQLLPKDNIMKILIGCEESQTICGAFRKNGYEAYSCDIKETRGNKNWHYKEDIIKCIKRNRWDLIILHPDCTYMALSGNRWYGKNKNLHYKRIEAIEWTIKLYDIAKQYSDHVALENPISVIFSYIDNVQYIQPWQFGHGETKKTGFALYNLPKLKPTNIVPGRENRIHKMPPNKNRKRDRSVTYTGIANAIVDQWGSFIKENK